MAWQRFSKGVRRCVGAGAAAVLALNAGDLHAAEGACDAEIEPVTEVVYEEVRPANSSWAAGSLIAGIGSHYFSCGKIYFGAALIEMGRALIYLGREPVPAGTGGLELGSVKADNKVRGPKAGVEMEFAPNATWDQARRAGMIVRTSLETARGSARQNLGRFNPGTGFGLPIPGPLGGPSGAFLPANPANIVEDMVHSLEMFSTSATLDFEHHRKFASGALGVYMGVMVNRAGAETGFEASIPGYASSFRYDTKIESRSAGLHLGVRGQRNIGAPLSGGWQPVVTARAQAGMAHTTAKMTDALSYSGFLSGFVPNTKRRDKAEDWSPYYEAGISLALNKESTWQQFFVDFEWEQQPFFGIAERDGTNPTRLKMSNADVSSVTMGFRWRF